MALNSYFMEGEASTQESKRYMISLRLQPSLFQVLEQEANATGETISEVVRKKIKQTEEKQNGI